MSANDVFQNAFYAGNQFLCVGFGIEIVLYYLSVRHLVNEKQCGRGGRHTGLFIAFSTVMFVLLALNVIVMVAFGEEMWIINANYPGGSAQYIADFANVWYETMGTSAFDLMSLLGDAFLMYRTYMIWRDWRVIVLPCLLWTASLGVGATQLVIAGLPSGNYFGALSANIGLAYMCILVANNVFMTTMICVRIWQFSHTVGKDFGEDARRQYTGIAAVVVESAMPYSLSGIASIIVQVTGSSVTVFFQTLFMACACLSPQMLVYRVVTGRAWTKDQTTMHFEVATAGGRSRCDTTLTQRSNDQTAIHLHGLQDLDSSSSVERGGFKNAVGA